MTPFNLPPGCTDADIDRAMGANDPRCSACGRETSGDDMESVLHKGRWLWFCPECYYESPEEEESDG